MCYACAMFAKKSLGQNFLHDKHALRQIVDSACLLREDVVLEVGPGDGALTELLLERAGKVIVVEKDARLIPVLREKFARDIAAGKLELIRGDILTSKLPNLRTYKLVANIPYYITGAFLKKFLQNDNQPSSMTLLLQKEVAERIVARSGKESILSISVKCYGKPRIVGIVKAESFSPKPKVDSAILVIDEISKEFFGHHHPIIKSPPLLRRSAPSFSRGEVVEEQFFSLVKKGFAHPRKLLSSNLNLSASILKKCGIAENARAENLSLEQWGCLAWAPPPHY